MGEKKFDQMLQIKTSGIREWKDPLVQYNRYEATPYKSLEQLFKVYKLHESDEVVDFGSGRGRVTFYIHHRFQVPVTGIEVNDLTYEESLQNKASYRLKASNIPAPIRLKYGLAEDYIIKPTDTCFYFFNPFSVNIFKQVVQNIIRSVKQHERVLDIILYYPLPEYRHYMEKTPFKLMNKAKLPGAKDKLDKFLIYRLGTAQHDDQNA